jgi:hypothetical protein
MKKIALILLLSMVTLLSAEAHKYKSRNAHITISIQTFYNDLAPYGDWIYSPDYGYVWRPYFDYPEAFRPYSSNGNWVYTEYGWTWVSNYDWGWATFHYGRWDFDNYLGWLWIPGYEWAPAWVTWGSYDNYWGWAPMGPNIYVQSAWYAPDPWWTFVPRHRFCSDNWNHYIYDRPVHVTNITNITNVYVENNYNNEKHNSWYQGPRVSEVERYNGRRVRTMEVVDNQRYENTGVRNDKLNVYRPTVDNKRSNSRPAEYRNIEQAHRTSTALSTNPRTNNPGENRIRENRAETRSTSQVQTQRTSTATTQNRVDPRTGNQSSNSRPNDITSESRDAKVTPRTTTKSETRTGSVKRETKVEPRSGSQVSTEKNTSRQSVEPKRETPAREVKPIVTEKSGLPKSESRINNTENRQARNTATNNENVKKTQSRQEKSQNATVTRNSQSDKTDRNQKSGGDVKRTDSKKQVESPEKRTSGNPARR